MIVLSLEGLTDFFAGFIFLHIVNLLLDLVHQQLVKHKKNMFAHDFNIFLVSDIMNYLLKIILQFHAVIANLDKLADDGAVSYVCH